MQKLAGKVAVVTGAGSGIGAGTARACAAAGMKVVIADLRLPEAERVRDELVAAGADAIAVATDVAELDSVVALADRVEESFGAVHLVCNNAGVWLGALMQEADIKDWRWLINVNLYGVIHGIEVFLPRLLSRGEGHIVNTASLGGFLASPPRGLYCTTKFAVVGLSEALLLELAGTGVGVSLLCPGLVDTHIMESEQVRPEALRTGRAPAAAEEDEEAGMDPDEVGRRVVDAVREDEFYIITHDEHREYMKLRFDGILAAMDRHAERYRS
ncbi:MAG: SDR family NAD(P)-dependent oxidoreductase [Deltaproteobacteria bacterium]|nr:SDR family NAD(P)-dependent oxidoreductase [Deltaproteobacteria bacterium]